MSTPEQRRSGAALFARVFDVDPVSDAEERPATRLTSLIISECLISGFTEIRVHPPEGGAARIEYGRDGAWKDVMKVPDGVHTPVVNRFKVMANLDVAKRPLQEGLITVRLSGKEIPLTIRVEVTASGVESVLIQRLETGQSA